MAQKKFKKITGPMFILCTFPLMFRGRPDVLAESDLIGEVFKAAPEHLQDEDVRLSICRVGQWYASVLDPSDTFAARLETIAEIEPYTVEAMDDDWEEVVAAEKTT